MALQIEKSFTLNAPAAAVWELLTDPFRVGRCLPGAAVTDKLDDGSYAGTITVKVGPVTANYRGKMRFERLDPAAMEAEIAASGQETRGKGGADMRMKSKVVSRAPSETEVTVTSDVNVVGVLAQFGRGMIQDVSDALFQKFTEAMRRELEAPAAQAVQATAEAAPAAVAISTAGGSAASPAPPAPAAAATAAPSTATAPTSTAAPISSNVAASPPSTVPAGGEPALDLGSLGAVAARRAAGRTLRRPSFWIAVTVVVVVIYWFLR